MLQVWKTLVERFGGVKNSKGFDLSVLSSDKLICKV